MIFLIENNYKIIENLFYNKKKSNEWFVSYSFYNKKKDIKNTIVNKTSSCLF